MNSILRSAGPHAYTLEAVFGVPHVILIGLSLRFQRLRGFRGSGFKGVRLDVLAVCQGRTQFKLRGSVYCTVLSVNLRQTSATLTIATRSTRRNQHFLRPLTKQLYEGT